VRSISKIWVGRDVSLLWGGQVVSQAGDSVYQIAVIWLMLQMTGSSTMTGIAGMAAYLPTLIFGLFSGVLSDRFDRRRIMISSDAARAALVLLIPLLWFLGRLTPLLLVLVTFCVASFATLFNPARDSLVPDIAPEGKLELANGLIQTSWQLAMFLGPALAGLLIPVLGIVHLVEFDSATFLLSMLCVLLISSSAGKHDPVESGSRRSLREAAASFKEGLAYSFKEKRIGLLLLYTAMYNMFLMGIPIVATPVFVKVVLDNRPETYAWLQAVYAGGMVIGAPLAVFLSRRMSKGSLMLAGIILDGITFCPLFFVETKGAALALMFFHSIFIPLILVPRTTLVQRIVERRMWGRIFAVVNVAVTGTSSISAALVGTACDVIHVRWVILIFGCLSASVGISGFLVRTLRTADA
jgi:DHA3 family macrolide efflux protein-like MFS transporter